MSRQTIGRAEKLDALAAAKLGRLKHKPLAAPLVAWGQMADQEPLFALSAAVGIVGWIKKDKRIVRTAVRMGASEALATLFKTIVKHSVDRTRPRVLVERGEYVSGHGEHFESDYNSFPSGHSAGALAIARAVVREYPDSAVAAYTGASAAGVAQLVMRSHYPTDVAAGFVVGFVAEAIVDRVFDAVDRSAPR